MGSVFLKYSRDAENEADRTGAKIMYEAGYDPRAMAQFFEKLQAEDRPGTPQFLSDHPNPGNRAAMVMEAISQLPPKRYIENTNDFIEVKGIVLTMKPYTAEQVAQMQRQRQPRLNLAGENSIIPANFFQPLNHSAFRIDYPSNWQVLGDGNSAVTIAPPAGISNDGIAYGAVISAYRPQVQQGLSTSTQQIYQALRYSNPAMHALSGVQPLQVNGLPGQAVNLQTTSPFVDGNEQPVPERDMLVTVQRPDGSVLWMMFIAPEQQFDALSPTFNRMLQSLQVR
jgi:hypothetical protein